tara:strand:- start:11837 stop:12121 length:285 start_codon:yes stop_codon:yes gene_type:complete
MFLKKLIKKGVQTAGNVGIAKNVTGLFIGEDSKKRQMGLIAVAVASVGYMVDYIDYPTYENILGLLAMWLGVAFSSKLTKLGTAMKGLKSKKGM